MFDHVTIRVSDLAASKRFYETVLQREPEGEEFLEWDDFGIAQADGEHSVTRHLHVGFAAPSRERSTRSGGAALRPATAATGSRVSGRNTTRTTTAASFSI